MKRECFMKQISFLRSKDPSHGEAPASLQDSRATTPALRLQGHLSPDVRLRARGTEPSQVLAQQPLQLQATPPTHLGKGARDASHGEGLLPPTWETGEGTAAAMAGGHQGKSRSSSGLPLHQQLCSPEREPCGSARAGMWIVNSSFQHRLRCKVQGSQLQGWPLCQSVSPRLPQLQSWPGFPCRGARQCLNQDSRLWNSLSFLASGKATSQGLFCRRKRPSIKCL